MRISHFSWNSRSHGERLVHEKDLGIEVGRYSRDARHLLALRRCLNSTSKELAVTGMLHSREG
jgi:hypothetical protein